MTLSSPFSTLLSSLSIYRKSSILIIALLGFASGLPLALTGSTLSIWLVEEGVSKSTIGIFAAVGLPYTFKFLWSHMVDHLPIPILNRLLGKRRSWLIATQIGLILAFIGLGASHPSISAFTTGIWALLVAFLSATQDIAFDAYRVERLAKEEQGAGAAAATLGYRVGMLVSSAAALLLSEHLSWLVVYQAMGVCMLVGIITTLFCDEPHHPKRDHALLASTKKRIQSALTAFLLICGCYLLYQASQTVQSPLWQVAGYDVGHMLTILIYIIAAFIATGSAVTALTGEPLHTTLYAPFLDLSKRQYWLASLLFILLFKFGDAFAGIMTNPFLIEIGFSKTHIAEIVKTFGFFATIIGIFLGGSMVKQWGILRSLWVAGILQMLSNLIFVWQAYAGNHLGLLAFTIGVENFSGGLGTAAFIAYISALCNIHYTATQYALLSALASFGRTMLTTLLFSFDAHFFPGSSFIDHVGWMWFFIITTLFAVPGLAMLWVMTHKKLHEM